MTAASPATNAAEFVDELASLASPDEVEKVSSLFHGFICRNEVDDTFQIARLLVANPNEYFQKATCSWLREAGKRDEDRLIQFLEQHAAATPRATLRYATEKLARMYGPGLDP